MYVLKKRLRAGGHVSRAKVVATYIAVEVPFSKNSIVTFYNRLLDVN